LECSNLWRQRTKISFINQLNWRLLKVISSSIKCSTSNSKCHVLNNETENSKSAQIMYNNPPKACIQSFMIIFTWWRIKWHMLLK
jgi:hypothetical protein